jgi:hypothetical protein
MSRSYRHTPRCGERKGKYIKRQANHLVRRRLLKDDFPSHAGYKRVFEQWTICDWESIYHSFEEYYSARVNAWHSWQWEYGYPYPDRDRLKLEFHKKFVRK